MTEMLTTRQVMAMTGFSRTTLWRATVRWRETRGEQGLRYLQHADRAPLRFRRRDVLAWLDADPQANPRRLRAAS